MGENTKINNGFTLFVSTRLDDILNDMDVPTMRKDISNLSNIRWLQRNLMIQNGQHANISEALSLLKQLDKQLS